MACLNKKPDGTFRIIVTRGERQKTIHLGKMPKKTAELCLSMVERIQACEAAGVPLDTETATWTARISDELHTKLVRAGVMQQRDRRTLGDFITQYADERTDWKPGTLAAFKTAAGKMLAFFGADTPIEKITAEQCYSYKAELLRKFSVGYTSKNIERAKLVFNAAVHRKLIIESPFLNVVAGRHTNSARSHFVTVESTNTLLEACNNARQRLIIILARYGGLRCPSELVGLRWSEVNWEKKRFIVHSPKTERHKGGEFRVVPLFPEVASAMSELWETLPEGADDRIFPEITEKKSLGSFIAKTSARAGVVLWDKPFQNMRASRATELIAIYPAHVVNKIMGHTEAVAMAHYRQILDSDFDKLSSLITDENLRKDSDNEHAILGLQGLETGNLCFDTTSTESTPCNDIQEDAKDENSSKWRGQDSNLRP